VFDLTGMTPPKHGLPAFGRKMGVSLENVAERSPRELCAATRRRHERTLSAIEALSRSSRVTLVPGNHDWALGGDGGRDALDAAGLSRVQVEANVTRTIAERRVLLQHGHELDDDNAAPGGAGEMLTRLLHHAIVPMLERLPTRPNVVIDPTRVVCLRPEERIVPVMQRWLSRKQFETFVDALLDLMVDIGSLSRVKAWLATPEKLRAKLDDADDLWERVGTHARDRIRKDDSPDVLVFGHTHVPDWALEDRGGTQAVYANLGSWTDRATDAVGPFDRMLPLVRIGADARGLRATLEDLESGRVLETFDASRANGRTARGLP
jgi:UDP-2,3-diacylglucosamine pyrophosphatase LpxH